MKATLQFAICVTLGLCMLTSCKSLPTQRGEWKGDVQTVTLFDSADKPYEAAAIHIRVGPDRKKFIPDQLILVDKTGKCFCPCEMEGDTITARGRIQSMIPLSPDDGKPLLKISTGQDSTIGWRWVLQLTQ